MLGNVRIRINWPLAVLVLGALAIVSGVWLTLVLTHNVGVDSLKMLGSFVGGVLGGGALPMSTWWREKPIEIETDSEPPPANGGTHAEPDARTDAKP